MQIDIALAMGGPLVADRRAAELAALGPDGLFTFENAHDVFFPLVLAATATDCDLMTNVAMALPRSPLHLAYAANDLQLLSGGRFRLGLGSQIRPHIERRYGSRWERPVAQMREWVEATIAILDHFAGDGPFDFRGEWTTHTLMTPNFNPGPNPHGRPPVLVGALGPRMTAMAAEVADGVLVMPFNSRRHLLDRTLPAIHRGLAASGRTRSDIEGVGGVICAVGRSARLEGFGLEALGIGTTGRTLPVDQHLQTVFPHILACGDVAGPYQFTHAAAHQAWYAAVNGLFGTFRRFKVDYRVIPWCTFLDPEIARVGLNEQEAVTQGVPFEVTRFDLDDLDRVIVEGGAGGRPVGAAAGPGDASDGGLVAAPSAGWVKVLTVPSKDRILGVTIVGRHAGELLAEWVMAMKHSLGLNKVLGTIHVYPTLAESAKYAAGAWKRAHQPKGLLRWVEWFHTSRRG